VLSPKCIAKIPFNSAINLFVELTMKKVIYSVLVLSLVAMLGACASSSPDVIQRGDAQRMAKIEDGVVLSVRTVTVDGSQSGVGAAVGGVVGAIGGYGGSGVQREAQVLGVLAGVAGAAAGNAIERFSTREEAVEILVQLKGGERRAIVQAKAAEKLATGDPVIIVTTGSKVRVTKAPQ
jgi:outer membrane lipoprotein SlyB